MYVCERNLQTYAYMCAMHHSGRITNRNSSGNKNETEQNLNVVCRYVHTFVVHSYYYDFDFAIDDSRSTSKSMNICILGL